MHGKTGRRTRTSLLALLVTGVCSQVGVGYSTPPTPLQTDLPELVLFLAGSAPNPFEDLSPSGHVVQQVPDAAGGQVQVVFDQDLNRNVFSFAAGGWLEVLDRFGLLTLTSADELTIEVGMKLTDGQMSYVCDPTPDSVTLPITQPVPDQVVFSKGPLAGYPRNYALAFGWNRDDMRKEYCDPLGYFPGLSYGQGGMSYGVFSPMDPLQLEGWQVHAFRIAKDTLTNQMNVWVYKDGAGGDWPRQLPVEDYFGIDQQSLPGPEGPYSLLIGNGYATSGTNPFNPNPFFGKIDYIRVYRGLLPVEELNGSPYSDIPDMPQVVPPTVALSDPVCSVDGRGKRANTMTASAVTESSISLSAEITDVQITNNGGQVVRGRGIWHVDGPNLFVYPNGAGWTAAVTVTATDASGNTTTETIQKALISCNRTATTCSVPALSAPLNNATGYSNPVTLVWNAVPGATSYDLAYDGIPNQFFVRRTGITGTSVTIPNIQNPGQPVYWSVRAHCDSGQTSTWGSEWVFWMAAAMSWRPEEQTNNPGRTGRMHYPRE